MPIRTRRHKLALAFAALSLAAAGTVGAVGAAPAPAEAAGRCVDYNYSQGGYSSCIGTIQQLLNYHRIPQASRYHQPIGSYTGLAVDNAFGPATKSAVVAFQRYWGLSVDGIVGPQSWSYLCSPMKGPGPVPGYPYTAARAAGCAV
ncbi:peptidoglycan-binding protein [Agromyces sp. MMS24-K17]|uniref:peptidoglycan-binding domain-containing protein n=1 Tax=Agromyces sp. MMS24-K17 TaxID=3372850 RepID=UPI003754F7BE